MRKEEMGECVAGEKNLSELRPANASDEMEAIKLLLSVIERL